MFPPPPIVSFKDRLTALFLSLCFKKTNKQKWQYRKFSDALPSWSKIKWKLFCCILKTSIPWFLPAVSSSISLVPFSNLSSSAHTLQQFSVNLWPVDSDSSYFRFFKCFSLLYQSSIFFKAPLKLNPFPIGEILLFLFLSVSFP